MINKRTLQSLLLFLFISLNVAGQDDVQKYVVGDVDPSPITIGGREVYEGDTVLGSDRIVLSCSKQTVTVFPCGKADDPATFNNDLIKSLNKNTVNEAWSHRFDDVDNSNIGTLAPKGDDPYSLPYEFFNGKTDSLLFGSEKRLAIVIGNSSYTKLEYLEKPSIDADHMQNTLVHLGFDVIEVRDATKKEMDDSFDSFFKLAREYDLAIVYYSGHGVWFDGQDYLLPIEARASNQYAKNKYYSVTKLLKSFQDKVTKRADANLIIIFDACRKPFGNKTIKEDVYPSIKENQLLFFAVSVGETALQGSDDRNPSPFTQALIEGVGKGEKSIYQEFYDVKCVVRKKYHTMNPQVLAIGRWFDNNSFVKKRDADPGFHNTNNNKN